MMTLLLLLALLSPAEARAKVEALLGAIDRPVTAEQWRSLGPNAAAALEEIATDPQQFPSRRAKAVEGLAAVAPARAAPLLGKMARDEKEATVVRVSAMRSLPADRAVAELKPVLQSARSPGMRKAAADVLARQKAGCALVKQQAARERAGVREAFRPAVERCGE